ncbi:Rne/Rng family ribonuclease [Canibacter sp. lx-72]|uniref:Rne/Rng family ribonuclease n=1 Tax=Canibacter zhuwentaonis TaxID=2837491 RepID=UPI001BDDA6D8|nr:Rne/Rng family ribonuclease [Canibacter zhuwentaonis]MBT1017712.1 Rne/Rng family ribonuclease [Canibacter zhuwentaonis]
MVKEHIAAGDTQSPAAIQMVDGNSREVSAQPAAIAADRVDTKCVMFLAPDVPPVKPKPRVPYLSFEVGMPLFDLARKAGDEKRKPLEPVVQALREKDRDDKGAPARDERSQLQKAVQQERGEHDTQPVAGSMRLEAKKHRKRDSRDIGRRRVVVTESEFLARRESVDRRMIVHSSQNFVQIGVLEDKMLVEHYVARSDETSLIGNVYLGKVQNVLPGMEAAFIDIGEERNAVLYAGEVDWSEYSGSYRSRKIDRVLKPGDSILVQVLKDPVGHKGARLTTQISLSGRFLVFLPGGSTNGISRKLPDTERQRLKKILKEIVPVDSSVIVRTASEGASDEQLKRDVRSLSARWEAISKGVTEAKAPVCLHAEPDTLIKIVRDVFNEDFQKLVIDSESVHGTIVSYLEKIAPELLERVVLHRGERDAFAKFRVTEQIKKALDRKVWLPSGGSLVLDRTEAMTVIDVNTGKFVGSGGNLEETVTKNNLEAAEEIVRQLRLRDIGGIIVIDFIDMVLETNRDLVYRRLIDCLGRDRTKHQVAEVTSLGLVQMTRKKIGLGLLESFSNNCEVCEGRGVIVQQAPVSHKHDQNTSGKKAARAQQARQIKRSASAKIAQVVAAINADAKKDETAEFTDGSAESVVSQTDVARADKKQANSSRANKTRADAAVEPRDDGARDVLSGGGGFAVKPTETAPEAQHTEQPKLAPRRSRRVVKAAGSNRVEEVALKQVSADAAEREGDSGKQESVDVPAERANAVEQQVIAAVEQAEITAEKTETAGEQVGAEAAAEQASAALTTEQNLTEQQSQDVEEAAEADDIDDADEYDMDDLDSDSDSFDDDLDIVPIDLDDTADEFEYDGEEERVESDEPHVRIDPTIAYNAVDALFGHMEKRAPKKAKERAADGGAGEIIQRHGEKSGEMKQLFDKVLGALPDPRASGRGRERARMEAEIQARVEKSRSKSALNDPEVSRDLTMSILETLLDSSLGKKPEDSADSDN